MTRVGLIARADNRGLGQQTWAFHRHVRPARTLVVDCPSEKPLALHLERFPGADVVSGWPSDADFARFVDGLDAVYTAETGYGRGLWGACERAGVRSVLHANYEFWDSGDRPSVLAAASTWNFGLYPAGTVFLPVPVETDRLRVEPKPVVARRFLHPVGRPAIHDRNGTRDLLAALPFVTAEVEVVVTCQEPSYVGGLIAADGVRTPPNVVLRVNSVDAESYWDKYAGVDAVVLPRRFGGLCLPAQEAVGCGLPVIMPDVDPNDEWLPGEWLTPAVEVGVFQAKRPVRYVRTEPKVLAALIDRFATEPGLYGRSVEWALRLRERLSWEKLLPCYQSLLASGSFRI